MIRRVVFLLGFFLVLVAPAYFNSTVYAGTCPAGSPNAGATFDDNLPPDRIDDFCNSDPQPESGGTAVSSCDQNKSFFGFPKWYKYIQGVVNQDEVSGRPICQPVLNGLNDIWRVVAAVVEMLLRISGLVAIGYIVYGGIQYVISQGQPDKTKTALQTVINALVGMAISVVATAMVTYVAGRF